MKIEATTIEGLKLITPDVHGDSRGWFCEQYNAERYRAADGFYDIIRNDNGGCRNSGCHLKKTKEVPI